MSAASSSPDHGHDHRPCEGHLKDRQTSSGSTSTDVDEDGSKPHWEVSKARRGGDEIGIVDDEDSDSTSIARSSISRDHAGPEQSGRRNHSQNSRRSRSEDAKTVITFDDGDPENPYNWSNAKKCYVVFVGVLLVLNSTVGSSVAGGTPVQISRYFHNDNQYQLVLPVSIYLVGYVLGPLVFGPASESYGRKKTMISTFIIFTAATLGCALTPTFAGYIVFRLFAGIGASSPIAVVGGIYSDIYADPNTRGRALAIFMTSTCFGPLAGPILSGFASPALGWRWVYWISLIFAGVSWPFLLLSPETYGPTILAARAKRLRKDTGNPKIYRAQDLEKRDLRNLVVVVLTRPVRMFFFEPLVLFTCLYCALVYAIFYIFIEAYPIVYLNIYHFNYGEVGLAFLPIGVGAVIGCAIFLYWDSYLNKAKKRNAAWSQIEEYRRLPLACLAGPFLVGSLFWMGWTARADIHWIVPVLSAVPFGIGYLLIFIALLNYLVDAYQVFAASVLAASSCSRSLFGAVLPFGARPLYTNLGVPWACSLLGFLSLLLCLVPFVFLKYGDWLRKRSKFCQELKRNAEETERKKQQGDKRGRRPPAGEKSAELDVEANVEGMGPFEVPDKMEGSAAGTKV